jgi:hypothetical protein
MWFRLLGAEIGSRVWLDSTGITEPDLVHIGDDCAIHSDALLQTHLFEDRILKMSHLRVGKKCSGQFPRRVKLTDPESKRSLHVALNVWKKSDCFCCSSISVSSLFSVGNAAVVLYDSNMSEGSHLMSLSLLMKGESLPAWSTWQGVPAHQTHSIGAQAPIHLPEVTKEELAKK